MTDLTQLVFLLSYLGIGFIVSSLFVVLCPIKAAYDERLYEFFGILVLWPLVTIIVMCAFVAYLINSYINWLNNIKNDILERRRS